MGRNWAITIGVNRYHNLHALRYAQQDAEAMRDFFQVEINFEQVYHFSDDSPPIVMDYGPPIASLPTYGTLRRFLRVRFEKAFMQDGDNFWFFFAGHGVRHEDRDYLMPIDADPGDVEGTGIPLNYITERLRRCGADNVVMLIDACRSRGSRSGVGVGTETQQGVITFFSCSPRESSYEIEELHQGAFTSVLLQGLRIQGAGNCATAERLYQYLRYHVPLLNQRYGKPQQTPYGMVEPPTKYHLILLPQQATLIDVATLKKNALRAEVQRDVQLARQFWIRVLSVSPADPEAIEGIERLSKSASEPQLPASPAPSNPESQFPISWRVRRPASFLRPRRSPGNIRRPTSTLPGHLNRRRLLQIASVFWGGMGVVLLGRMVIQLSSTDSPTARSPDSPTAPPTPQLSLTEKTFNFEVVIVNKQGEISNRQPVQKTTFVENLGGEIRVLLSSVC